MDMRKLCFPKKVWAEMKLSQQHADKFFLTIHTSNAPVGRLGEISLTLTEEGRQELITLLQSGAGTTGGKHDPGVELNNVVLFDAFTEKYV
jgi:hypothetical protein